MKGGIETVVAWVLLVGFSITLGVFVFMWATKSNDRVEPCGNVTKYNFSCLGDYALDYCKRIDFMMRSVEVNYFFCKNDRELRQFFYLPEEISNCSYEEEVC